MLLPRGKLMEKPEVRILNVTHRMARVVFGHMPCANSTPKVKEDT